MSAPTSEKTYVKWVNSILASSVTSQRVVHRLPQDLSDGLVIQELIHILYNVPLPDIRHDPARLEAQKLDNANMALNMVEQAGVKVTFVKPKNIVDCDQDKCMGLLWTLIKDTLILRSFQVKKDVVVVSEENNKKESKKKWFGTSEKAKDPKNELLEWVRSRVAPYGVTVDNFTTDWQSGMAFCALVHSFNSDFFDYTQLYPTNYLPNCQYAFDCAEHYMGIAKLLDAEDMTKPEETSVMTYVASFLAYENDPEKILIEKLDEEYQKSPNNYGVLPNTETAAYAPAPSQAVSAYQPSTAAPIQAVSAYQPSTAAPIQAVSAYQPSTYSATPPPVAAEPPPPNYGKAPATGPVLRPTKSVYGKLPAAQKMQQATEYAAAVNPLSGLDMKLLKQAIFSPPIDIKPAISRASEMYNKGNLEGSVQIYKHLMTQLSAPAFGDLKLRWQGPLKESEDQSLTGQAWGLRHELDLFLMEVENGHLEPPLYTSYVWTKPKSQQDVVYLAYKKLIRAVTVAAPTYERGDIRGCYLIYHSCLNSLCRDGYYFLKPRWKPPLSQGSELFAQRDALSAGRVLRTAIDSFFAEVQKSRSGQATKAVYESVAGIMPPARR